MIPQLPTPSSPLKIGTRGSPLALAQAHETRDRLQAAWELEAECFEICIIKTTGDDRFLIESDTPLKTLGGKGLFTREIEADLSEGKIDLAVHSMKDMPVEQPEGLILDVFLPREDVRDALVAPNAGDGTLASLPVGAVVGTSSLRRRAQLLNRRPDLVVVEFRGNVQTRLRKLQEGVADCTLLAMAGLRRLSMAEVCTSVIEPQDMLPAIAQGAIGIERRQADTNTAALLEPLHHVTTAQKLTAERAFLRALDGSCETPIAGLASLDGGTLHLQGEILRPDGSEVVGDVISGPIGDAQVLGRTLAKTLLARGGEGFFDWRTPQSP